MVAKAVRTYMPGVTSSRERGYNPLSTRARVLEPKKMNGTRARNNSPGSFLSHLNMRIMIRMDNPRIMPKTMVLRRV